MPADARAPIAENPYGGSKPRHFETPQHDGVIDLSSQLRGDAKDQAASVRGYDEGHVGILDSGAVSRYVNRILAGYGD